MIGQISFRIALGLSLSLLLASGCQPRRGYPTGEQRAESYYLHEIKFPGETMGLIANWYTGSTENYTALAAENPNLDLNRMRIGDVVRIPERMLVRRDELPARVVRNAPKSAESKAAPTKSTEPAPTKVNETPLADQVARESGDLDLGGGPAPSAPEIEAPVEPARLEVAPEAPVAAVATPRDVRIKTRDELLEELLK